MTERGENERARERDVVGKTNGCGGMMRCGFVLYCTKSAGREVERARRVTAIYKNEPPIRETRLSVIVQFP